MFGQDLSFHVVLFLLVCGHYLADYSLQSDYISQAKSRHSEQGKDYVWINVLLGHSFIHALCVYVVTTSFFLSIIELISHAVIDYIKCEGEITHIQDQILHLIVILFIAIGYVTGL